MAGPLRVFGETVRSFAETLKTKSTFEEEVYLAEIREMMRYSQRLRDVLSLREEKQRDHEEIKALLIQQEKEKVRLEQGSGAGMGIVGALKDRLDEAKGRDMERLRRARLEKTNKRVQDLREAVRESGEISRLFSREVVHEAELFEKGKRNDLKHTLGGYVGAQVDFYRQGLEMWEEVIGKLERQQQQEEEEEDEGSEGHHYAHHGDGHRAFR